jgi:hypothetical protein
MSSSGSHMCFMFCFMLARSSVQLFKLGLDESRLGVGCWCRLWRSFLLVVGI